MKRVVLGNGVVGLSIAFGLLRSANASDEIVVVGPPQRPGSATLAAAAMLNSFAEIEHGGLDTDVDLFRFEMSHRATRLWPAFEQSLIDAAGDALPSGCSACQGCAGGGCFKSGTYVINNNAADDLDDLNFDAILTALVDFNEQHDVISPKDIPHYKPHQRYRASRALFIHNEGWFNPRIMLEKMEGALRRAPNVRFVDEGVDRFNHADGAITHVTLMSGKQVEGDQFVLATGATAWDVLDRSGLRDLIQRIFYGIGTSLEIRSPDDALSHVIRTPNRGLACGLYAAPYFQGPNEPNDHVLVGASNFIAPQLHAHGRLTSIEGLLNGAIKQINSNYYRADLIRVNVGARPNSQDTYPLLGKTSINNLFAATGTKRDGFHLAPLISEVMAKMLHGEAVDERYALFAPSRKPLRTMTREEAVSKAVRHQMSAAYQHGFSPATSRMPEQIVANMRDAVERLHDQIGAKDWGIPPEMLDMYRYGHARP
ncbi:NAD(P)/FAD-dependent oxidoreductase [Rhizobium leguminosarum]|uniref:NAD(P)/FAD-dependent oxidoreductase n=1 Tax=Rhizobium leguminosarum TaxID=384 RepID=UPI001FF02881|nr:FAD-dependent oxidoreductase [Rhizobium leguminosarum]